MIEGGGGVGGGEEEEEDLFKASYEVDAGPPAIHGLCFCRSINTIPKSLRTED